jgi:hypothetical protein
MTQDRYNADPQPQYDFVAPPRNAPPKKRRAWPWVVAILVLVVCGGGLTIVLAVGSAATKSTPTLLATDEAAKPHVPGTIQEGVWPVGVAGGVSSGTYRVTRPLEAKATCYWQISKDSESQDIVKNDFVTGGTPQVTLTKGQWFKTQGCGEWKPV